MGTLAPAIPFCHYSTFFSQTAANAAPHHQLSTLSITTTCLLPSRHRQFLDFLSLTVPPSFSLSACMACMSDESWVYLPSILSGTLPLGGPELQNKTDEPNSFDFLSPAYRLERVFPVYAMGIPKASSVHDSGGADLIWDSVRQEAKLEAEKEPILSNFLYASVLSHDCLEQALAFVLANRLQNPTLLATQLTDIFCHVIMHNKGIQRSIRLDVQAFKDRDPACLSYCSSLLYMKANLSAFDRIIISI